MISQPCTVYDRPGSRKSMPVSYAILKSGNVLPPDDPEVVPPDVVLLLPPPPPHPAATNARPTARVVIDTSHFHRILRFNTYLPVWIPYGRTQKPERTWARRAFFQTTTGRSSLNRDERLSFRLPLPPGSSQICEIGAVKIEGLEIADEFATLVDPRVPLGATITAITGLTDQQLRGAPVPGVAVRRFLAFAGDAVLVAHNARFDLAFLDRETERLTGRRLAGPVVDTVSLARRVLEGRVARASLASLAHFFGTSARPCHRALPEAQATAAVLVALIGLAQ